jgi:GxxExxY protein
MESVDFKHKDLSEKIIKAFFSVYNTLGSGFLEKVYRNAMVIEIQQMDLKVVSESKICVYYNGQIIGEYFADLLVEDTIVVELKAVSAITEDHKAQLLNYLKATPYEIGLLLNFGQKPEISRKAYENTRKGSLKWLSPNPNPENSDHPAYLRPEVYPKSES